MKSFIAGLLTIVALGVIGFYTFKATTSFMSRLNTSPSPTPSSTASPTSTPAPTVTPSSKPDPSYAPTTKGGEPIKKPGTVKGATTTKKVTTTTTTSHLTLTLVKTSSCPISYMTEVKDIQGPLTLRYELIDNTSFGITVWNKNGEELVQNTTYSGRSGQIKTISGVDYMKVRVESKSCASNNDNWIKLTAER
jgi:hypothetical protein